MKSKSPPRRCRRDRLRTSARIKTRHAAQTRVLRDPGRIAFFVIYHYKKIKMFKCVCEYQRRDRNSTTIDDFPHADPIEKKNTRKTRHELRFHARPVGRTAVPIGGRDVISRRIVFFFGFLF